MTMVPRYKCRLCGKTFSSENEEEYRDSATGAYDEIMSISLNYKSDIPLYAVHKCGPFSETVGEWPYQKTNWYDEERIGLGDLIGFEERKEHDQH